MAHLPSVTTSSAAGRLRIKRTYEPASDGDRVLVDRLWPRGVSKDRAYLDAWMKESAPSTAVRRWFGHDPARLCRLPDPSGGVSVVLRIPCLLCAHAFPATRPVLLSIAPLVIPGDLSGVRDTHPAHEPRGTTSARRRDNEREEVLDHQIRTATRPIMSGWTRA